VLTNTAASLDQSRATFSADQGGTRTSSDIAAAQLYGPRRLGACKGQQKGKAAIWARISGRNGTKFGAFCSDRPSGCRRIAWWMDRRLQRIEILRDMAPQAGLEPATLRLTEAVPKIYRARPSVMKMMKISELAPFAPSAPTAIDRGN
jgi:hypothetical protein